MKAGKLPASDDDVGVAFLIPHLLLPDDNVVMRVGVNRDLLDRLLNHGAFVLRFLPIKFRFVGHGAHPSLNSMVALIFGSSFAAPGHRWRPPRRSTGR